MELSSAILTLREKQKHDLKASEEYKECQSTLRDTNSSGQPVLTISTSLQLWFTDDDFHIFGFPC